jgi:hypothetical protein
MVRGPDRLRWSVEDLHRRLTGRPRLDLDEYHPLVLTALLAHLPDAIKRETIRRAQEADYDETTPETGDPEWDEMERAVRAGVDPSTLPSWKAGGDNARR